MRDSLNSSATDCLLEVTSSQLNEATFSECAMLQRDTVKVLGTKRLSMENRARSVTLDEVVLILGFLDDQHLES